MDNTFIKVFNRMSSFLFAETTMFIKVGRIVSSCIKSSMIKYDILAVAEIDSCKCPDVCESLGRMYKKLHDTSCQEEFADDELVHHFSVYFDDSLNRIDVHIYLERKETTNDHVVHEVIK